jgi:SNF2 family DNA or RNA helicase
MQYTIGLTKPHKTYKVRFTVTLVFDTEQEHSALYKAVTSKNIEYSYSSKTLTFFLPINVESVIAIIRLSKQFTVFLKETAKEVFNPLYEEAAYQIKMRQYETAYIGKLKELADSKITLKDCEAKHPLYNHQRFLYLLGTRIRKSAYFCDPGTGKTAPAILSVAHLVKKGEVHKCVVVVPGNLLYKWAEGNGNEIQKHSKLDGMVLDGDKPTRLRLIKKFLADRSKTFLITSYSFWSGRREGRGNRNDPEFTLLMTHPKVDMFILDESHKIKNPTALVTKNVLKWFPKCKRGIILSGTPQPRCMLDIFTQSKLIEETIFGSDYYRFRERYFDQEDHFGQKWRIKSSRHRDDLMRRSVARALVYSTDRCLDLPKEINETVYIYENDDYLKELRSLSESEVRAAMDSGDMGKGLLTKLSIATGGFTYQKDALGNKVVREFKHNPKAEALETLCDSIHSSGKKSIIWYMWTHDLVVITRLLDSLGYKYITIQRSDDQKARYDKAKLYDNSPDIPFLVASPRLISEGFDIYSPAYAIYYSYSFDFLPLVQSKARNRRFGSIEFHKSITYYMLCVKDSVEEDIIRALKEKKSIKDAMFGICTNVINQIRRFRSNRGKAKAS